MIVKSNGDDVPCVGIINFNILIHKLLNDGSIDPEILDCSREFSESNSSNVAQITVTGINKLDCVNKVKRTLERLNDD